MPHEKKVSIDELSQYFHLPIVEVSKRLGVCCTVLKKICRKNNIKRWPHRKFKSLDNLIGDLETSSQAAGPANGANGDAHATAPDQDGVPVPNFKAKVELSKLQRKRAGLLKNPNASVRVSHIARKVGLPKVAADATAPVAPAVHILVPASHALASVSTVATTSAPAAPRSPMEMAEEVGRSVLLSLAATSPAEFAKPPVYVDPRAALASLNATLPLALPSAMVPEIKVVRRSASSDSIVNSTSLDDLALYGGGSGSATGSGTSAGADGTVRLAEMASEDGSASSVTHAVLPPALVPVTAFNAFRPTPIFSL